MTRRAGRERLRIAVIGLKGLPAFGGSARAGENMIRLLRERYDFVVYNTASHTERRTGVHEGVTQIVFSVFPIRRLNTLVYYVRALLHALLVGRYDVVHVFHLDAAFVIPLLRLRFPVIAGHRARPQEFSKWGPVARAWFAAMEWIFYKLPADVLTSVSPEIVRRYQDRTRRRIRFLPNGVLVDEDLPRPEVPWSGYVLFASGRVMETKGTHLVFPALRRIGYEGKLVIAGNLEHDPAYGARLQALAEGLDVEFLGLVKDKALLFSYLRNARVIVYPSFHEGMSNMLLEAGSVGRPVVCSDIPENRAIFEEDETVFFRSGDEEDLAQKLAGVLADEAAALETALRGRERIRRDFAWETLAERHAELYEALAAGEELD